MLPAPHAPAPAVPPEVVEEMPLLQSFMVALERETGLHMSFDDLTGYMRGFHADIPLMNLDWQHQLHACDFCEFAKSQKHGLLDCVMNKLAVNRRVIRSQQGLEGHCRLGLFDMAEPLIHDGKAMGVFFYGSVLVQERLELTRARIHRHCARRNLDPRLFLDEMASMTVISEADIPRHREALRTVVRLARYMCESSGLQHELYRYRQLKYPYEDPIKLPYIVKAAMTYVSTHLEEPFIVKDIANHLQCHPDFLSRRFKQHTGVELSVFLKQARVDHAKQLLLNPQMEIGTVSELSGFSDRVHFSKVFRRMTGMTPGGYRLKMSPKVEPAPVGK